jgi:hypothetical protein
MVKEAKLTDDPWSPRIGSHATSDRKVREWLLLLLRFAITRAPTDQSAALAMADELDSLDPRWRPTAPTFFARTSNEVCQAILMAGNRRANQVLEKHAKRIQEPRLRRAFRAAVGLKRGLAAESGKSAR